MNKKWKDLHLLVNNDDDKSRAFSSNRWLIVLMVGFGGFFSNDTYIAVKKTKNKRKNEQKNKWRENNGKWLKNINVKNDK